MSWGRIAASRREIGACAMEQHTNIGFRNALRDFRVIVASVIISVGLIGGPVVSASLSSAHPNSRGALGPNRVLRGEFALGGGAAAWDVQSIKLPRKMKYAIRDHRTSVIDEGAPYTTQCPGVGQVTQTGWLCIYVHHADYSGGGREYRVLNPVTGLAGVGNSRMILMLTSTNSSKTYVMGSWALRTGDASTAP